MRIANDIWIVGPYYVEIDVRGQLCIVGPENHLHFGSVGLQADDYEVKKVEFIRGKLELHLDIRHSEFLWRQPAIGHIRKVREFTEIPGQLKPTFDQVYAEHPEELAPNHVQTSRTDDGYEITYRRQFRNDWYGVTTVFPPTVDVKEEGIGLSLKTPSEYIPLIIRAESSNTANPGINDILAPHLGSNKLPGGEMTAKLLQRGAFEIEHLVRYGKTSGFDYGTIFPRDWMEAADLGTGELTPEAVHYMYQRSLDHVDPSGEGWHEDIIGEFRAEKEQEMEDMTASMENLLDKTQTLSAKMREHIDQARKLLIVRNMIDIEPHYILGLVNVDPSLWTEEDKERLRRVAEYIIRQATMNRLITFKRMPPSLHRSAAPQYYGAGDWRDSEQAYKQADSIIAPFDVNVVFYPQALAVIAGKPEFFGKSASEAQKLLPKWEGVRELFRFSRDGMDSYALALYGISEDAGKLNFQKLEVNHLDEAYDHFYGAPSDADTASFSDRLMSPEYFYTPSGPTVVGANEGYSTLQYHGRVIWTKQSAFAVGGLMRTYLRLKNEGKHNLARKVEKAICMTAEASISAYRKMGVVPELHYDQAGRPRFYSDQPLAEGPMNKVQLWSAAGVRRIIKDYGEILDQKKLAR